MGVGQQRDFYKLKQLSKKDIEFVRLLAVEGLNPRVKRINEGWLNMFTAIFQIKENLLKSGVDETEIDKALDLPIHNIEEDFHSSIEGLAIEHLRDILNDDVGFFKKEEACLNFLLYICIQYFRTKSIKHRVLDSLQREKFDITNSWNILSHMFASTVAWSLYTERHEFRIVLLHTVDQESLLITGDQPVLNTFADETERKLEHDEFEFYYPISPNRAILLTKNLNYSNGDIVIIKDKEIDHYNSKMVEVSHEQIYSHSDQVLKSLI